MAEKKPTAAAVQAERMTEATAAVVKAAESIERACAVLGRGLSGFVELAGSITRLGAALETTQRMGHELAVRQRKTSANTATALEELRAMRQPKG